MKNLEKYLPRNSFFRLETCILQKLNHFARIPGVIRILQKYLQNVDCSYCLSKFLQQF